MATPASRPRVLPLALGALGVVFGDIGTSPLYAFQQVFVGAHPTGVDPNAVFGVLSLIFWTLTLIVSVKYVLIVMRADNDGEGGIMALAALVGHHTYRRRGVGLVLLGLGVLGASLFYGDSMITPAVSVLSAVEGLEVVDPGLADLVVPIAVAVLVLLFAVQRWGTGRIGGAFGPVMVLWFAAIGVLGLLSIADNPEILRAISPTYAFGFIANAPFAAFLSLGSVILCVTGAEALYADMGHFGRRPIRVSWFVVAAPALYLNYLGQGALVIRDPGSVANPFYRMVPESAMLPMVILATMATVIASQAVITGAFSLTEQAVKLGYLPRMTVRHTSAAARGQIYVPAVNWILMIAVVGLVLGFRNSDNLASAYGLAVSGTFLITTVLITVVAHTTWRTPLWVLVPVSGLFLVIDTSFFAANLTKIGHGGWFPLVVAAVLFTMLMTWGHGRRLYVDKVVRTGLTDPQLEQLANRPDVTRIPGTSVFVTFNNLVPLALGQYVEMARVFHEDTIQICIEGAPVPRVDPESRFVVDHVFRGFTRIHIRRGFMQTNNLPAMVADMRARNVVDIPHDAVYVVRTIRIHPQGNKGMMLWRKHLYAFMMRLSADPSAYLHMEEEQVIEFTSVVRL